LFGAAVETTRARLDNPRQQTPGISIVKAHSTEHTGPPNGDAVMKHQRKKPRTLAAPPNGGTRHDETKIRRQSSTTGFQSSGVVGIPTQRRVRVPPKARIHQMTRQMAIE